MPSSVRRLFPRYHPERLRPAEHRDLIIPAVLEGGLPPDWQWLFETYGWNTIRHWLAESAHQRLLSPRVAWFWTGILLEAPQEWDRWAGGNQLRRLPLPPPD